MHSHFLPKMAPSTLFSHALCLPSQASALTTQCVTVQNMYKLSVMQDAYHSEGIQICPY